MKRMFEERQGLLITDKSLDFVIKVMRNQRRVLIRDGHDLICALK